MDVNKESEEKIEEVSSGNIAVKDDIENKDTTNSIEQVKKEINSDKNKENLDENDENKSVKKEKNKKKSRKVYIFSIIAIIIVVLIAVLSTIFALMNINNEKIIKGVHIKGISVENLTKEEATNKLNEIINASFDRDISLKCEDYEVTLNAKQLEASFNIEEAVDLAYSKGRESNIIKNNYEIIKSMFSKEEIDAKLNFNEEELNKQIEDISTKVPGAVTESSYYIEEDNLIITKGKEGKVVKQEELKEKILSSLNNITRTEEIIDIPFEIKTPDAIDIEKIYQEVHTEPKDAYYTTNPFKVYPHVDGVDFKISMDEAKALLSEDKEEYVVPLKITKPSVTTDKIGSEAFPDLLGTFNTKYDASNTSRTTNLRLASNKINGTVLMPGETFSYNKVVGERTIAAGYKEAAIYAGGKVVDGLGGGICQISSTLYNAVIYANLDIVSRSNHMFVTSYVSAGRDATVVYGSIDFKFKNNRNYPIKINSSVKNGIAKIDIYGIKEEVEYTVDIKTSIIGSIPYTTVYTEDPNMAEGKEVVTQKGANGCIAEAYKVLSLNGKVVSKTLLSKDTYSAMKRLVTRGTKKTSTQVQEPTAPVEQPSTTPTTPTTPTEEPAPTTPTEPTEQTEPQNPIDTNQGTE